MRDVCTMTVKKRTSDFDWDDARSFLALARAGSLSGAARTLGVNHATIGRRLAGFEATLGLTLIERRASGWTLTRDGQAVATAAAAMEQAADSVGLRARGADAALSGAVRLSATEGIAERLVAPSLVAFHQRYPEIRVELISDSRSVSLARRQADLALRWQRPSRGDDLFARRIATVPFQLYGRPIWRDRAAPPLVGYDESLSQLPEAQALARLFPDRDPILRANSSAVQAAAVRAGVGVGFLPRYYVHGIADLVVIRPGERVVRELWLLLHRDLRRVPKIRALADHLLASLLAALG